MKKLLMFAVVMICMSFTTSTEQKGVIREIESKFQKNLVMPSIDVSVWEVHGKKFVIVNSDNGVAITPY